MKKQDVGMNLRSHSLDKLRAQTNRYDRRIRILERFRSFVDGSRAVKPLMAAAGHLPLNWGRLCLVGEGAAAADG
jgi:hypothetical protein